jgi:hypothetical protein
LGVEGKGWVPVVVRWRTGTMGVIKVVLVVVRRGDGMMGNLKVMARKVCCQEEGRKEGEGGR